MKKSKLFRTAIAVILALVAVLAVSAAAAEYTTDDGIQTSVMQESATRLLSASTRSREFPTSSVVMRRLRIVLTF